MNLGKNKGACGKHATQLNKNKFSMQPNFKEIISGSAISMQPFASTTTVTLHGSKYEILAIAVPVIGDPMI